MRPEANAYSSFGPGGWGRGERPEDFYTELLNVVAIDPEERIAAQVIFDPDDIDAAFADLDARYLAGEAAANAHMWAAMTQVQAAYNRHEFPPTTEDAVNIDHRRGRAFAPGDVMPFLRATYDVTQTSRVTSRRAPAEQSRVWSSQRWSLGLRKRASMSSGARAPFRMLNATWSAGSRSSTRRISTLRWPAFDELQPQAQPLENAATQLAERIKGALLNPRLGRNDGDYWPTTCPRDDRRRVVNAGNQHGREVYDRKTCEPSLTSESHERGVGRSSRPAESVYPSVVPACRPRPGARCRSTPRRSASSRSTPKTGWRRFVMFDLDDIDTALAELDARYVAGEAADHAHTWSVVCRGIRRVQQARTSRGGTGSPSIAGALPRSSPAP